MQPGTRLGRYTIGELIGRGGMGAVYRATDTALGRDVAIKVLPPEVAGDPERLDRFRREARALAALNHPHIVTIYSVEQDGDVHFLTMELVPGQPLDRLLSGQGLPIDRVRQVAAAVADALVAAHEKGIIHRDLKPANIMVGDVGQTKVLDFGLSKIAAGSAAAKSSAAGSVTHLSTEAGTVLGTPAYMSPEQVSGRAVDERTDIFSLGVLLYEMVTGVRPFTGQSSAELTSSILRDEPRPVADLRSTTPGGLSSVIARCLEKHAASRFSSMIEVRDALTSSAGSHVIEAPAGGASIAVLPFKNLSADADSEFFSDGLAEEILNALSQIDDLRVAARMSSFSFKGQNVAVGEIGAKLHVATVLDGSVRRTGNHIRVTAQLIEAANGFQLWSGRYDRELADVFDVQDEIARAIVGKLKITLTAAESNRLVKQATTSVEAYDLYLRGRALLIKRGKHAVFGFECLKRAVELDPKFAAAWAGLADAYTVRGYTGSAPGADVMPKALTAARRAVALDPEVGEAHCALAAALLFGEHDYALARAEFQRGLELSPRYTQGRAWYGLFSLQWVGGRLQEGLAEVRRAYENDPLSAYSASLLGIASGTAGELADALKYGRLGAEREPDAFLSHWVLALALTWTGQPDAGIAEFRRAAEHSGHAVHPISQMAHAYSKAGKIMEAKAIHDELLARRAREYVPWSALALTASSFGDMDAAIEFAHQAADEREPPLLSFARVFPDWQRLRDDPRFADVLRRLALPPL
jgi:serine/threonine protein kinase/tetratricopeptide (TPR) repeat protein